MNAHQMIQQLQQFDPTLEVVNSVGDSIEKVSSLVVYSGLGNHELSSLLTELEQLDVSTPGFYEIMEKVKSLVETIPRKQVIVLD
jgi:hypothetical protein